MAKRDFHFKYENSIPIKKKRKPKNPAPPINAKRNPSAALEEVSEYDELQPEPKEVESGDVYIDLEEESDVKVYEPKRFRGETPEEIKADKDKNRLFLTALIFGILGAALIAAGICIAVWVS